MPPFSIHTLDHVVLRVADLTKSLAFYVDALGCRMDKVQETLGLYQLRAGTALIDLVPLDGRLGREGGAGPGKEGRNLDHLALEISPYDEDAIRAHLAAHGIAIGESGRRYGARGFGPSLYIADPDGNVVELKGPPEQAEPVSGPEGAEARSP